jgi:predicted permease
MKRFLDRQLGPDDRRAALGDLEELYQRRRARDGVWRARWWRVRQLALYPVHLIGAGRDPRLPAGEDRRPRESAVRHLLRDLRYGARSLGRSPGLALTVVLTVGLGIGATATLAGMTDAVLIRSLPYPDAGRLVRIFTDSPPNWFPFSVADYRTLEREQTVFAQVAGYQNLSLTYTSGTTAERVRAKGVTAGYFALLGLSAAQGRVFDRSDAGADRAPLAVVSHDFWTRMLGADPGIVGRSITLDGAAYVVAGVLAPGNGPFERGVDVFTLERWATPQRKGPFFIAVIGRLAPTVGTAAADAELHAINRRMFPIWRASYQDERATWSTRDLKTWVVGNVRTPLLLVMAAVTVLFGIACINAANLLVVRAVQRRREAAVRAALGASRARLVMLVLAENVLLAVAAGLVGTLLGLGGLRIAASAGADYISRTAEFTLSANLIAFLAGLVAISTVVFTAIPLLSVLGVRVDAALRGGGRWSSEGAGVRRVRRVLVAAEFAAAVPLLIAAGLLAGSLSRLQHVDPGFQSEGLLTAEVSLPQGRYPSPTDVRLGFERLHQRLLAVPGVLAASSADSLPPVDASNINNFDLEDRPTPPGRDQPVTPWISIEPDYFAAMGIQLQRGRLLEARDYAQDAPPVVVVDRAWAQRLFPGEEVLGRRFKEGGCTTCAWTTVVGLVSTVMYQGLDTAPDGAVYSPIVDGARSRFLIVRASSGAAGLAPSLMRAVKDVDPTLPVTSLATGEALLTNALEVPRYLSAVVVTFSLVALLVSVVGIFGVMSQVVEQQARDIGIRIALGGAAGAVKRMILGNGLRVALAGTAIGLAAAFGVTRFMRTILFEIGPTDLLTFSMVTAGVVVLAAIATWIPAGRAARIDPAVVLRDS